MRGKRAQNSEIAYTMPAISGVALQVRSSANAWWMDQEKLQLVYTAFTLECPIREVCVYAGITEKQYKYFRSLHPEIDEVRDGFEAKNTLRARMAVMKGIDTNPKIAMKYLERKRPEEFGLPSRRKFQKIQTGMGTPLTLLITDYSKASTSSEDSNEDSRLL